MIRWCLEHEAGVIEGSACAKRRWGYACRIVSRTLGEPNLMSLTAEEHEAIATLGKAWSLIAEIIGDGRTRSADLNEVVHHIHALQHFVMAQSAARTSPDQYRLAGETLESIDR